MAIKRTIHRFLPRVGLVVLLALCSTPARAEEIAYDFRGQPYDGQQFRPTGSNHGKVVQSEPRGLRITLPADHVNKQPVGLALATGVRGDFEITMDFEILQVDTPTAGYGAGVSIYIASVAPTQDAATIARIVRPDGAQIYNFHHATTPADGKRQHRSEFLHTQVPFNKLRLVRTGTNLIYQFAQGDSNVFQDAHEVELGTEDLETVRFAADNGGSPTLVDVRIKAVNIKADEFGMPRSLPPSSNRGWWLASGLVVLVMAGGGYWFWLHKRQGPAQNVKRGRLGGRRD
jgi:hypothetical protein